VRTQTFLGYLAQEQQATRLALLAAYETKDRLLYVEAPALRQEYMLKIGTQEEKVLEAELSVAMLRRKLELIQTAINRREPVDEAKIDKMLEKEREDRLQELEDADRTLKELPELSDEEKKEMQRIYRRVIDDYHPGLHPDLSDTQKALYQKAMEAYQQQDLEALRLVSDMMYDTTEEFEWTVKFGEDDESEPTAEEKRERYHSMAVRLSTDYTLAKELYSSFAQLEDDVIIINAIDQYRRTREEVLSEVGQIRAGFPFNAKETLSSSKLTAEYISDLASRQRRCDEEINELNVRIAKLLEVSAHG